MSTTGHIKRRKVDELLPKARAFYIINDAGLLEHHEHFVDTDDDPDLHSAMFATVHMYAKQLGGGEIELISLEHHKFAFSYYEGKLVVLDVDVGMDAEDSLWLIQQIMDRFDQIEQLRRKDPKGKLLFKTLFVDQGRAINWDTIKSIRESAIMEKLKGTDLVETTNITKVNVKSKVWIKIRQILSKVVNTHPLLSGALFFVKHKNHINILYSGRVPLDNYQKLMQELTDSLADPFANIEQEPKMIKASEQEYAEVFPAMCYEGAMLAIVSKDLYELERLAAQIQRILVAVEKLTLQ